MRFITNNSDILKIDVDKIIEIYNLIEKVIIDEPPFSIREGGFIKDGYNSELDELRNIAEHGQDYLLKIETEEREKTGIKALKIKYNKVFGYFIEVTKANAELVPDYYIRKQTLVNAERYIVPELKEYEDKILNAKNRIATLEYYLFKEVVGEIKNYTQMLQDLSDKISYLDVISNLAYIAIKNSYIKPEIVDDGTIEILGGRHPIVEKLIPAGEFVKNRVMLNSKKDFINSYIKPEIVDDGTIEILGGRHPIVEKLIPAGEFVKNRVMLNSKKDFIILTGPNMSGKSTYMKQIALIIIMAHMGSYVPADYAKISLTDKIFTRIGASDDLLTGQSTFMLEMSEVANILNSATDRSFIILDEIGRGTSTFDGISIASAITEYIHDKIKAKTIFATHYHELTELGERLERASNFRIEVQEKDNKIKFLRDF